MGVRLNFRIVTQRYGRWLLVLALPVLANGLLWRKLVVPLQADLQQWHDKQTLTTLRPRLEELLGESRRLVSAWERNRPFVDDPAAALQAIQRLADRHKVRLTQRTAGGVRATGRGRGREAEAEARVSVEAVTLDLEAAGRFSKLAHWLSDIEAQPGFQVESWAFTPAKEAGEPLQLTVKLMVAKDA